jgi:hypothetical protein
VEALVVRRVINVLIHQQENILLVKRIMLEEEIVTIAIATKSNNCFE